MGRQGPSASRNAQKWQVAPNRSNDSTAVADRQSEDEHGGSTRASSTELGRQAPFTTTDVSFTAQMKSAQSQKENDDRARWADVESDGEEAPTRNARIDADGVTFSGKKSKNGKARIGKMDLPPPCPPRNQAPCQVASRQSENNSKTTPAYRPPKQQQEPPRQNAFLDSCFESANKRYDAPSWDASSWGSSARGGGQSWSSDKKGCGGSAWDEGAWSQKAESWSQKAEARAPPKAPAPAPVADFGGSRRGGKEKNESFKRGPHVTTVMDSSRLAW